MSHGFINSDLRRLTLYPPGQCSTAHTSWVFTSLFACRVCVCLVAQLCPTLRDPMGCSPPVSCAMGILQARLLEWVAMPSSRGSSNPGIKPRSPASQADSLSTEPPGKPKNTGVGSLSLLQGIFLTQESNWGLLHCRQILYWLRKPFLLFTVWFIFLLGWLSFPSEITSPTMWYLSCYF